MGLAPIGDRNTMNTQLASKFSPRNHSTLDECWWSMEVLSLRMIRLNALDDKRQGFEQVINMIYNEPQNISTSPSRRSTALWVPKHMRAIGVKVPTSRLHVSLTGSIARRCHLMKGYVVHSSRVHRHTHSLHVAWKLRIELAALWPLTIEYSIPFRMVFHSGIQGRLFCKTLRHQVLLILEHPFFHPTISKNNRSSI